MSGTLFELVGEETLRAVIVDFYDRVFADLMIGYLFGGQDKARLIEREYEFAACMLGADISYRGRGMRAAHARHPIMRGHFDRRLVILKQAMARHDVPAAVGDAWIDHTLSLRTAVLGPDRDADHCVELPEPPE